jgi:predicted SAM-dependent methyltransferase
MQQKKIHLGCGNNILTGWENYDFIPTMGAKFIDLTKPLNFDNNSVDYIFFEHTLEHFDEVDGFNLLQEFYRILKKDAVVRIVTPSLDTYIDRYFNWNSELNYRHDHRNVFSNETQFLNYAFFGENVTKDIKFLNGMISCEVGHKFIYSKKDIFSKCEKINFREINFCDYKKSKFSELSNLETRPDYTDIIVELIK